jgi:hypothetical protein
VLDLVAVREQRSIDGVSLIRALLLDRCRAWRVCLRFERRRSSCTSQLRVARSTGRSLARFLRADSCAATRVPRVR